MVDKAPTNVVALLSDIVGAILVIVPRLDAQDAKLAELVNRDVAKDDQIAELQGDRTTTMQALESLLQKVADLQGHAETVTGETGLTSQLGDLSAVPALHDQLAAAMPAADAASALAAGVGPEPGTAPVIVSGTTIVDRTVPQPAADAQAQAA